MNFFLLSDTENLNFVLKERLQEEILKRGNKIAYISSEPQNERREYFARTSQEYSVISNDISLEYFDLSDAYSDAALERITDFDIIHLSGGNTFAFLASLRKRGIESLLRNCLQSDKLIIGVSAGAIVLTPTIGTASVGDGDANEVGINDLRGFGLVDFAFLPHFYNTAEDRELAKEYSASLSQGLYACSDADGIFVDSGKIKLLDAVHKFQGGMAFMIEKDILNLIREDKWMMNILSIAEKLNFPDWVIGAGFIRNKVWDYLHGFSRKEVVTADIDLIYYDLDGNDQKTDEELSQRLQKETGIKWEIVNEAYAHKWNNLPPYKSTEDALSQWPETATGIGVHLDNEELKLIAPYGIDDLINLIIRPSPKFPGGIKKVRERTKEKGWMGKWPELKIVD